MPGIPLHTLQRMAAEGDRQATSILDRFERRYLWHRMQQQQYRHAMAYDGSNEGRGAGTVSGTVNGTETRAGRRWHGTPADAVRVPERDAQGRVTGFVPIDRAVYNVHPDGTRTPWIDPRATERKRTARARQQSASDALRARLQAAARTADQHDYTAQ